MSGAQYVNVKALFGNATKADRRAAVAGNLSDREAARTVSDYISGMTEREAVELHRRLSGASLGSVLDPLAP